MSIWTLNHYEIILKYENKEFNWDTIAIPYFSMFC